MGLDFFCLILQLLEKIYWIKIIWVWSSDENDQVPAEFGLLVSVSANCAEKKLTETFAVQPSPSSNHPEEFLVNERIETFA